MERPIDRERENYGLVADSYSVLLNLPCVFDLDNARDLPFPPLSLRLCMPTLSRTMLHAIGLGKEPMKKERGGEYDHR